MSDPGLRVVGRICRCTHARAPRIDVCQYMATLVLSSMSVDSRPVQTRENRANLPEDKMKTWENLCEWLAEWLLHRPKQFAYVAGALAMLLCVLAVV